jgi:hypothetical protein
VRRPHRTIEIFSMSVLDLFAAALGAFIMVAVILFPNYLKQSQTTIKLQETQDTLRQCTVIATNVQKTINTKEQALAICEANLASTFLVVAIEWNSVGNYDVDLHITDPEGHEFFWDRNNRTRRDYPSSEAQLSYDNTRGPGVELWQHPKATPGVYKIAYDYYRRPGPDLPVEVKGNVFYRNGRSELAPVTLTETHKTRVVASIVVGRRGEIEVQPQP